MGCDWNYHGPADVFAEMAQLDALARTISPGSDWSAKAPSPIRSMRRTSPATKSSSTTGFPTASGRGKIVPANVSPPDELPDADYPMVLSTGRVLEHWHTGSMTRRADVLDAIEPEAIAFMSPQGHATLRTARSATPSGWRRGAARSRSRCARIATCPENMVFMPFCYAEAAANLLTNPALDPFGKIPEFKFCAARVSNRHAAAAE